MKNEEQWKKAKKLCQLSNEDIRMARELGMGPRSLIKNIPNPRQRWKAPVKVWIRDLYEKKFGRRAPASSPQAVWPTAHPPDSPESFFETEFDKSSDVYGPPTAGQTAEEIELIFERRQDLRLTADYVAEELAKFEPVTKIVLFGSVASPPRLEEPRFGKFPLAGQLVWHECHDVDLAVWITDLTDLDSLRKARSKTLALMLEEQGIVVDRFEIEIFFFSPETDAHLGRLCTFGECPMEKPECRVLNCGAEEFLRQVEGFVVYPDALSPDNTQIFFERGITDREIDELPF